MTQTNTEKSMPKKKEIITAEPAKPVTAKM